MNDELIRQRRNLIITSSIGVIILFVGIEIEKLNFIFINLKGFENPERFLTLLLVCHLYFLWRYYQYFNSYGKNPMKKEFLNWFFEDKKNISLIISKNGYYNENTVIQFKEKCKSLSTLELLKFDFSNLNIKITINTDKFNKSQNLNFTKPVEIQLSFNKILYFCLTRESFTNYFFPFLYGWIAIVFYTIKIIIN